VDYGMGNLRSAAKALEQQGARVEVGASRAALRRADGVVLPGDGAFAPAVARLKAAGLFRPLQAWIGAGRPFLGICLGMQLLFDESEEFGLHRGFGSFPGRVVPFARRLRVPHMGWNRLEPGAPSWLLRGLAPRPWMYFVHSFLPVPTKKSDVTAWTTYGGRFASAVARGAVAGVQFHPEKSQRDGQRLLANFLGVVRRHAAAPWAGEPGRLPVP
jgi:glutamine amidotransferase